ncbi:hypothetical protein EDB14_4457 [Vibrio crassostreae]|nr:hypothetical protein EDB14_4457 [Vibrio crassostreae]
MPLNLSVLIGSIAGRSYLAGEVVFGFQYVQLC